MKEFELNDEEIRACKAKELVIYQEEAITAYPPDRAIAKAQVKKLVEWLEEHNCQPNPDKYRVFGLLLEEGDWQALLKEIDNGK